MHGMKGCDYVLKSMEKKGEILRVPVGGLLGGCVCESAIKGRKLYIKIHIIITHVLVHNSFFFFSLQLLYISSFFFWVSAVKSNQRQAHQSTLRESLDECNANESVKARN